VPESAPVRALLVDDEPLALTRLRNLLATEKDIVVVGEASSGSAAVEAIARQRPDIVFLDVQMPGLDGFGVLRHTVGLHAPVVIFVTAHDEHAIRAFEVHAADYLLKPLSTDRFRQAVRRAVERARQMATSQRQQSIDALLGALQGPRKEEPLTADHARRIAIKVRGRRILLRVSDLDWAQADRDRLTLHSAGEMYTARKTIQDLASQLPSPEFIRIHRSIIVNVARIKEIRSVIRGGYELVLHDGTVLRAGRTYRAAVQQLLK
jgi:two-component system LytT family response regulator